MKNATRVGALGGVVAVTVGLLGFGSALSAETIQKPDISGTVTVTDTSGSFVATGTAGLITFGGGQFVNTLMGTYTLTATFDSSTDKFVGTSLTITSNNTANGGVDYGTWYAAKSSDFVGFSSVAGGGEYTFEFLQDLTGAASPNALAPKNGTLIAVNLLNNSLPGDPALLGSSPINNVMADAGPAAPLPSSFWGGSVLLAIAGMAAGRRAMKAARAKA